MEEKINQAIKDALSNAPKRKFVESVDITFTIKDVDLKNPTTVSRKKSVFHQVAVVN